MYTCMDGQTRLGNSGRALVTAESDGDMNGTTFDLSHILLFVSGKSGRVDRELIMGFSLSMLLHGFSVSLEVEMEDL